MSSSPLHIPFHPISPLLILRIGFIAIIVPLLEERQLSLMLYIFPATSATFHQMEYTGLLHQGKEHTTSVLGQHFFIFSKYQTIILIFEIDDEIHSLGAVRLGIEFQCI